MNVEYGDSLDNIYTIGIEIGFYIYVDFSMIFGLPEHLHSNEVITSNFEDEFYGDAQSLKPMFIYNHSIF